MSVSAQLLPPPPPKKNISNGEVLLPPPPKKKDLQDSNGGSKSGAENSDNGLSNTQTAKPFSLNDYVIDKRTMDTKNAIDNIVTPVMQQQKVATQKAVADNADYIAAKPQRDAKKKAALVQDAVVTKPTQPQVPDVNPMEFMQADIAGNFNAAKTTAILGNKPDATPDDVFKLYATNPNSAATYFGLRQTQIDDQLKDLNNKLVETKQKENFNNGVDVTATNNQKPLLSDKFAKNNNSNEYEGITKQINDLTNYKNELTKSQQFFAMKHAIAANPDKDPSKIGKDFGKVMQDPNVLQQDKLENKGLSVSEAQKFNTEQTGYNLLSRNLDHQHAEGEITNDDYLNQKVDLDNQKESSINKYPEYKKQQIGLLVAQTLGGDARQEFQAAAMGGKSAMEELAKKVGTTPENLKYITYDDIPNESFGSNLAKAIVNPILGISKGLHRVIGSVAGIDPDIVTQTNETATQGVDNFFGNNPYAKLQNPDSVVDPETLQSVSNPNKGKYNYTAASIKNAAGSAIGGLLGFVGATKALGTVGEAAGLTDATAEHLGMYANVIGSEYEDNYQNAARVMPDATEAQKNMYALGIGAIHAAAFEFLPKEKLGLIGKADDATIKDFTKAITTPTVEGLNETVLKKWGTKTLDGILKTAGESGKINAAQLGGGVMEHVINGVVGKDDKNGIANLFDPHKLGESFLSMAVPLGIAEIPAGIRHSSNFRETLYDAGMHPMVYKANIEMALDKGLLTQDQANSKIQVVNTMASLNEAVPDVSPETGKPLTHNQKVEYTYNKAKEIAIKAKLEKAKDDKPLREIYEKQVAGLEQERSEILNGAHQESIFVKNNDGTASLKPSYKIAGNDVTKDEFNTALSDPNAKEKLSDAEVTGDEETQNKLRKLGDTTDTDKKSTVDFTGKDNNFLADKEPDFFTPEQRIKYHELKSKPETEQDAASMVEARKEELKNTDTKLSQPIEGVDIEDGVPFDTKRADIEKERKAQLLANEKIDDFHLGIGGKDELAKEINDKYNAQIDKINKKEQLQKKGVNEQGVPKKESTPVVVDEGVVDKPELKDVASTEKALNSIPDRNKYHELNTKYVGADLNKLNDFEVSDEKIDDVYSASNVVEDTLNHLNIPFEKYQSNNGGSFYFTMKEADGSPYQLRISDHKMKYRGPDNNIIFEEGMTSSSLVKDLWDALPDKALLTKEGNLSELYHKAKLDGSNPELVKVVEQSLSTKPEIKGEPATVIKKKNTGTEIEPELSGGRKQVTLSGSTEEERQKAIEQRKKETNQTPMTSDRDKLLERINKFNKLSRSEKNKSFGEVNSIKLAVDSFNKKHGQEHSIRTTGSGALEMRNNPTDARPSGTPIKSTLRGEENHIVENVTPLFDREDKTKQVFNDLLENDKLPVARDVNGKLFSDSQKDATVQDIIEGIPSQRAENYLNSLDKQIKNDAFDFGNPDKNAVAPSFNDLMDIQVEHGEPMTVDKVHEWLNSDSELTPEDETTFDNIDNLITHYEQRHEQSEEGTGSKVSETNTKGTERSGGQAEQNEQEQENNGGFTEKVKPENSGNIAAEQKTEDNGKSNKTGEKTDAQRQNVEEENNGAVPPIKEDTAPLNENDGNKVGASHESLKGISKRLGLEQPERGTFLSPKDQLDRGRLLLSEGADPLQVVAEFNETGKVSADEISVVRAHQEELHKAADKSLIDFGFDSEQYKDALKKANDWDKDVIKKMGTASGAAFSALQGETDLDTGSFSAVQRAVEGNTGKPLTDKESETVKDLTDKVKRLTNKVDDLQKKLTDAVDKAVNSENATKSVKEKRNKIADKINKIADGIENFLKADLPEGAKKSGFAPDIQKMIADAMRHIAEGIREGKSIASIISEAVNKFANDKFSSDDLRGEVIAKLKEAGIDEKEMDIFTKFSGKKGNDFSLEDVKDIWGYAKDTYLNKGIGFSDMLRGVADDLGLTTKQVLNAIEKPKNTKAISDEMYRLQNIRNDAVSQAKAFVKNSNTPKGIKFLKAVPSFFFKLKTFGHGTVGAITHAGTSIFKPSRWKIYFPFFLKQFKYAFGSTAAYEKEMEHLKNDSDFTFWKRAGLAVDPKEKYDDYQGNFTLDNKKTFFLKRLFDRAGVAGDRGFNALKVFRLDLAKSYYDNLSASQKADPQTAIEIAKLVNHASGTSEVDFGEAGKVISTVFFAPKLEASRWQRLITDPTRAVTTLTRWNKASEAEKASAIRVAKNTGELVATYTAMLAANTAMLALSGSQQKINWTNPTKSDFLKFKVGGKTLDLTGGMLSAFSFLANLVDISTASQKDLHGKKRADLIAYRTWAYGTGKFSPFAATVKDIATQKDFEGNTMPNSNDKPAKGKEKLTWLEYIEEQQTPIPISEALKVAKKSMKEKGMSDYQIEDIFKGIAAGVISGGTGAKVEEEPK